MTFTLPQVERLLWVRELKRVRMTARRLERELPSGGSPGVRRLLQAIWERTMPPPLAPAVREAIAIMEREMPGI